MSVTCVSCFSVWVELCCRPTPREVIVEKLAVHPASPALTEPAFGASLSCDAEAASKYFASLETVLQAERAERKGETAALKAHALDVKEKFFRRHAVAIYDELTGQGARTLRVSELLAAASSRYPALLPSREQID